MGKDRKTGITTRGKTITVSFQYRGRRCRETIKLAPTAANLKYAERLRGEILRKIELGTFDYREYFPDSKFAHGGRKPLTVAEVAKTWLDTATLTQATRRVYQSGLDNHILPKVGDRRIADVSYSELLQLVADVPGSAKSRNNVLGLLRCIWRIAHLDGTIPVDISLRVAFQAHQKEPPDPFTNDELITILNKIEERYGPEIANWFGFAAHTGCRPSEQIAAEWGDIDWKNGIWRISRAKVEGEDKSTKTNLVRDHILSARALAYLERQRQYTQMRGKFIFLSPTTGLQHISERQMRCNYWQPVLAALKFRYRKPYCLRHTYITLCLHAGQSIYFLARQAGNSPPTIMKHYFKWLNNEDKGREMAKLDGATQNREATG